MHPDELESRIDRTLRALPPPRAPHALLPRIMAAVATADRPWYARGWRHWPAGWQLATAATGAVLLAALWQVGPALVHALVTPLGAESTPVGREAVDVLTRLAVLRRDMAILWRVVVAPVATLTVLPLSLLCAATLAFGAALGRLASFTQEASQS